MNCQLCNGDFLPKELFDLKDTVPGGARATCYQCGIKLDGQEIDRLTAALHAARVHPDYRYIVMQPASTVLIQLMQKNGWERCQEAQDLPLGNECWRRNRPW